MKQIVYFSALFLVMTSCVLESENNDLGGYIDEEAYQKEFIGENKKHELVEMEIDSIATDTTFIDFTNELVELLHQNDLINFASYFHPDKGCRFVPYTFMVDEDLVFTTKTFQTELSNHKELHWGSFDVSGEAIEYTITDYFKRFVYDINYKDDATDIHINENLAFSNTLNNIEEFYPEAQYIEFYYEGTTEYEGMDWSSLIFYVERSNNQYFLVAVVHNQWTI